MRSREPTSDRFGGSVRRIARLAALTVLLASTALRAAATDDLAARLLAAAPSDPTPCCAGRVLAEASLTDVLRLRFVSPASPEQAGVWVRVARRDDRAPALARTRSFDVSYEGAGDAGVVALARAVAERIAAHDSGGLVLDLTSPATSAELATGGSALDAPGLAVALALLVALLAFAWPLGRVGGRTLVAVLGGGWRGRAAVLAVFVLSLGLRVAAPQRLVTYYMGYRAVAQAATLDVVPKYGPAAYLPYHLLFRLTGPSHAAWIGLDQALGALLPLTGAWLLALSGAGRLGVAAGGLLLAATPLFVKDAASESMAVPAMLWMLLGLAATLVHRTTPRPWLLVAAVAGLGLAMLARPEALLLAPVTVAALWALGPPRAATFRWAPVAVAAGTLVALGLARGVQFGGQVTAELALGNAPQLAAPLSTWLVELVGQGLLACNAAFWPSLFPWPVTLLGVASPLIARPGQRRVALALTVLAFTWIVAARADLPYLSVPRLHAPGLALLTLAAALGLGGAWARLAPWLAQPALRRGVVALGVGAFVLAGLATVPRLWERTNADDEEAAFGEALDHLPAGPLTLLVRTGADLPREPGHFHYPEYLLAARGLEAQVRSLDDWRRRPEWDRPVYAWLGTRCALRDCRQSGEHPACRALRAELRLLPVVESTVPVRRPDIPEVFHREAVPDPAMQQDLDFPWCVPRGELTLGLYRVEPRTEAP